MPPTGCITTAEALAPYLNLSDKETQSLRRIISVYPLAITPYYLSLVDPSDPEDPIRKMCVPSLDESLYEGQSDTSGEADNTILEGLQHKYRQTALILSTEKCAMYCRHCFRKRLVGKSTEETKGSLDAMADYVALHDEITNVLISGGDAFLNSDSMIEAYLERFSKIGHIDFIRIGTRTPVVWPERITKNLLEILAEYAKIKPIYIITQFNHPRELSEQALGAIRALQASGLVIRNQTVLLKGVNDDPEVLGELLRRLAACAVLPYYVFQCRPVLGVKAQFQVPFSRALPIVNKARSLQNGQGKSFRYCMSHPRGKIELLDVIEGKLIARFHQAKSAEDDNRLFSASISSSQAWLDENLS